MARRKTGGGMRNPKSLENLTPGNPGNKGGGAPKLSDLKRRDDLLDAIWADEEEFDPQTAHPFVSRIRELAMTSNSSATLEYLISQRIGGPKTRMDIVFDGANFLRILGEAMHELGFTKEQTKEVVTAVYGRLPNPDA